MKTVTKSLGVVLFLTTLFVPKLNSSAIMETSVIEVSNPQNQISLGFPAAPSGQGKITGGTQGGGTRGTCLNKTLVPLIPQDQVDQTLNSSPTFFAYVPENDAELGEFVVMDSERNTLYTQQYKLPQEASIVRITLPSDSIPLEKDQVYFWELALVCQADDRAGDAYVVGAFTIINLDQQQKNNLKQELETATNSLEKAEIYAKNRLWNETIEIIAQFKDSQPDQWQELLNSIGIEESQVIQSPIIEPEKQ